MSNEYRIHIPRNPADSGPRCWRRYKQKTEPLQPLSSLLGVPAGGTLRPFYAEQAKERQRESGGDVRNKTVPEKIRERKDRKAREASNEAGAAAGVNGRHSRGGHPAADIDTGDDGCGTPTANVGTTTG